MAPRKPKPYGKVIPRPSDEDTLPVLVQEQGDWSSPLAVYLKTNNVSKELFARTLGVTVKAVHDWCTGSLPSIPYALEIERVTKGVVFIEQWAACPNAKEMILRLRSKQPEAVANWPKPEGGGYGKSSTDKEMKGNAKDRIEEDLVPEGQADAR